MSRSAENDAGYSEADVQALAEILAPVVEHRRHYGMNSQDAEEYAREVLDAGYRVTPPGGPDA